MLELQLADQRTQRFGWITGTQSPDEGRQRLAIRFCKLPAPAVVLVEVAGALLYRSATSLTIGNENQLLILSWAGPVHGLVGKLCDLAVDIDAVRLAQHDVGGDPLPVQRRVQALADDLDLRMVVLELDQVLPDPMVVRHAPAASEDDQPFGLGEHPVGKILRLGPW